MDDCSEAAFGLRLQRQGHQRAAARRIVAEFADANFLKHRRAWCRFWCAYASNVGILDFFAYNMYEGCACLEAVH